MKIPFKAIMSKTTKPVKILGGSTLEAGSEVYIIFSV
jgi:hypothetical protein